MAANSICWRMPTKFTVYPAKLKRRTKLFPVLVEFRRLLDSSMVAVAGVSNKDLLHAVVALYDTCLPEITPEVLYSTVCGKWAKTLILVRGRKDVLQQIQGISQEDSCSDQETDDSPVARNQEETKDMQHSPATEREEGEVDHEDDTNRDERGLHKLIKDCAVHHEEDHVCSSDSGVIVAEGQTDEQSKVQPKDKDSEPGKFEEVFSDTDGSEESSEGEDDDEDFSKGVEAFIEAVKERRHQRQDTNVSRDTLGIESLIVGAATYERSYSKPGEKVVQLDVLAVRKRFRRSGVGKIVLDTLKDPTVIGAYDTIAVYADQDALEFFKKNNFTDDVVLNSRFSELTDHWINSTLMCYLPPFTGSDMSGVFRNEAETFAMEQELKKWREKSLEAHQAQMTCMVRMQHEIQTLRATVETQEEVIRTLTSAKERLEREKHKLEKEHLLSEVRHESEEEEEEDDLYQMLADALSKKHISEKQDFELEAISHGDFRDVSQEEEGILSSLISSHNEKQLVQQVRRSLLADGACASVTVERMTKVESSHVATMETTFDSRAGRLGDPSICAQLYYCGGSTEEHMDRIMKRGFTKEDFTRGPYGKGLYFSMHASQASHFAMPGKLLLASVGLGLTESVVVQDRTRIFPPPGFDSILTQGRCPSPASPGPQQQEYVVFDPLQAFPVYLIEYSTSQVRS